MGYYLPKDGIRVRFYTYEDTKCPTDVTKWRKLDNIKRFNFQKNVEARIVYYLGSSYGQRTSIAVKGVE